MADRTQSERTAPRSPGRRGDTAARILDSAERHVQERGFNGFSYADVASELGVTTASLHYHFAGKTELGRALIERYAQSFSAALDRIEQDRSDARAKLEAYAALYADVLGRRRMCLCGMLAAEYQTLPEAMREALLAFFDSNEAWLERVLERGGADGSLRFLGSSRQTAQLIVSSLEGAMLVARPYGDVGRFQAAASGLLAALTPSVVPPRTPPA